MNWFSTKKAKAVFLTPALLIYGIFLIFPIVVAAYYSFTDFSGIGKENLVGLENYTRMFGDRLFLISLKNTALVLLCSFFMILIFSFFVAYLLNKSFVGNSVSKAMIFSPYVIAPIIVGVIWGFILNPQFGLLNTILRSMGFDSLALEWIGGKALTPVAIAIVFTWQVLGFHATIFLAGMKTISSDIYEAASIDGANRRQTIFLITIPLLKETIIMNVVLIITGVFKIYELVYQLTGGGPNHLSEVLISYMYYTVFTSSRYGYGMAIAVFVLILSIVFSFSYIQISNKRNKRGAVS